MRYIVQGQRGYQVELASDASGWSNATYRHEIGDVSVVLRAVTGQATTRDVAYKTTDRLGSPLGILDKTGQFRQRAESGAMSNANTQLNFSPFGAAREPTFQPRTTPSGMPAEMPGRLNLTPSTRLGFTGHEHLDSLGLIHMNGRVYDHRLGRFLSVDPFIQFPANSQSLNPYSYIMNNPMAGTDPTGYKSRDKRRFLVGGESCVGKEDCEYKQTFSGPISEFRKSFSSGGAPSGTWNGWEAKQQIRKAQNNARSMVEIGALTSTEAAFSSDSKGTAMSQADAVWAERRNGRAGPSAEEDARANGGGSVHVNDMWEQPFTGPLTKTQIADVVAVQRVIDMLRETVKNSDDADAQEALDEVYFAYIPGYGRASAPASWGQSRAFPKERPSTIEFGQGFAAFGIPGSYNKPSYNMWIRNAGPTLQLYLAAHELGHAVQRLQYPHGQKRENSASNYGLKLIQHYPRVDREAVTCLTAC